MRNWIAAALILVLGLSLTACGNDNAGTTANRWNDAAQQQANARGPIGDAAKGVGEAAEDALDGRNDTTQKAQNDVKTAKEQAN